jgi:hypothetical protein
MQRLKVGEDRDLAVREGGSSRGGIGVKMKGISCSGAEGQMNDVPAAKIIK